MIATVVFDLETTGVDVHTCKIVTAYVGLLDEDGKVLKEQEWICDPGAEFYNEDAAAVHGWTQEKLDAEPRTRRGENIAEQVALEIAQLLWALGNPNRLSWHPVAGHNLAFDLTMLQAHLARKDTAMFPFGENGVRVLDSIVLDKKYNKYVKGSGQRKLIPTAARYGIALTDEQAHAASFDAIAAGRICQAILARHQLGRSSLLQLHDNQIVWRAEQQAGLQKWLRGAGNEPTAVCEPGWPVH